MVLICVGFVLVTTYTYNPKVDSAGDNASYYILGKSLATGQGYSNIHLSQGGSAKHFPPGYPVIIAGAILLGFDEVTSIKLLNYVLLAGALFFIYLVARQVLQRPIWALTVTLVCVFNPIMLQYSSMMMSEIPFLFFSILTLWLFLKSERLQSKSLKDPWFWTFAVVLVFSFYIRSIAIAVLAGACLVYLRQKNFAKLIALALTFVALVAPWMLRNSNLEGSSYISQLLMKNPLAPADGMMEFGDWPLRIWNNVERYLSKEIFASISGVDESYYADATPVDWLIGVVLLGIALFGLFKLKNGRSIILPYFFCTLGILLLWPDVWFGPRFLLPLVPILVIGLCYSWNAFLERFPRGGVMQFEAIGLALVGLIGLTSVGAQHKEAEKSYTRGMLQVMNFGTWMKENAAEDAVVCSRKPALFYLFSDRKGVRYLYTDNTIEQLDHLNANDVNYVIFDALGYESTPKYLVPLIKKHQFKFFNVHHYKDPEAILFEFTPKNGYNGEWENGKKHGQGNFLYPNGDYYKGQWQYDLPNGEGTMQIGDTTYIGMFGNGLRDGRGKEVMSDGTIIRQGIYAADTLMISQEQLELLQAD